GTNSFESVVLMKEEEIKKAKMPRKRKSKAKQISFGQERQMRSVQLVDTQLAAKKIEEWTLHRLERSEEVTTLPQSRLGDRENWIINEIVQRIQAKFTNMNRHDFTIKMKRGH
ncbi:hypothetical protein PMAYCL1PPCAC_06376, partial [Pristionchus mayeri]